MPRPRKPTFEDPLDLPPATLDSVILALQRLPKPEQETIVKALWKGLKEKGYVKSLPPAPGPEPGNGNADRGDEVLVVPPNGNADVRPASDGAGIPEEVRAVW